MLRNLVLAVAAAVFFGSLVATPFFSGAWTGLIWGGVLLLGVAGERFHYRGSARGSGGSWERTGEQFRDPETGRRVTVDYNPQTGERRYREDG